MALDKSPGTRTRAGIEVEDGGLSRSPEYPVMVLLIDDQPIVGRAVRNLLAGEPDIDMHYCADPGEAIALAAELRPTVILQDLVMPTMDGLHLVRLMRENPSTTDTPIIVLSSKEDPVSKSDAFAAGANDYLVKLPDKLELAARVRYHSRAYLNQLQRDEAYRALRESQQKLLESNTRLHTVNQELEAATKVKAEFLAAMSHEIRTPLSGVIGMTTLLADTALTTEQSSYVETIRSSGNALLELINDILDFSKIEAGKLDIEEQPFDLVSCVEETLDLLAVKASEKKLALGYLIESGVPTRLFGDVGRIRQILINLIGNAVKFTLEGEVSLVITRPGNDDETIQFCVRDTGIGIPRDRQDRLFKSFSQMDRSMMNKFGGTGLGLAISKTLCEKMGGRIWVESEAGDGSTFHFTLKLKPLSDSNSERVAPRAAFSGKRVLIIEDKPGHQENLKQRVESLGMSACGVSAGKEALQLLQAGSLFDALIMNSRLPDMDVLDLVKRIRSRAASKLPRLILMTPQHIKRLYPQAQEAGVTAFLFEPVREAQFCETFSSVFEISNGFSAASPKIPEITSELVTHFPLRILVAEDNPVNQRVAISFLRKLGYQAEIVSNGREVVTALERQTYDILFMDVQMPEMDGLEASRRICEKWSARERPKIIAMTANAMQGDRDTCSRAGMDDYISKPISLKGLQQVLERWGKFIHEHRYEPRRHSAADKDS